MELRYNIVGTARKEFARVVGEILAVEVVYQGTPSFAFAVGGCIIDRYGNLHCPPNSGGEVFFWLIAELKERGYVAENEPKPPTPVAEEESAKQDKSPTELAVLVIELPNSGFTAESAANIGRIIQSKATLIRNAIGENLIPSASHLPVEVDEERIRFPWFIPGTSAVEINAYSHLLIKICEMAEKQKYVIAQERDVENQKYAFRCFLLRLGFIGSEYGAARKILLANLTGNGSHKNGTPDRSAGAISSPGIGTHVSESVDMSADADTSVGDTCFRPIGPFVFVGKPY